jgi:hypothetical protein
VCHVGDRGTTPVLELAVELGADVLMEVDVHRFVTATVAGSGAVLCDVLPDEDDARTPTGPNIFQIKDCLPNNTVIFTSVEGRSYVTTAVYAELVSLHSAHFVSLWMYGVAVVV